MPVSSGGNDKVGSNIVSESPSLETTTREEGGPLQCRKNFSGGGEVSRCEPSRKEKILGGGKYTTEERGKVPSKKLNSED